VCPSLASYPIHKIDPVDVFYEEDMGTKHKFWCRVPNDNRQWLYKFPRPNTGEHWAEKIAAEFAPLINCTVAQVEFAEFEGTPGSMTRNIRENERQSIVHGNELLSCFRGYEKDKLRGQSLHTFKNIVTSIDLRCGSVRCSECLRGLCGYLVLDAWIGNTDRHHENWAVLRTEASKDEEEPSYEMCPSFDHASSLGRELTDESRSQILQNGDQAVDAYRMHKKARSAMFWEPQDTKPLHNLELIRRAHQGYPECFAPWVEALKLVNDGATEDILARILEGWMSQEARKFVLAVTARNRIDILECLKS